MSGRFKRHISKASTSTGDASGSGNASGALARKKRRLENGSSEDEERSYWTPKHLGDLKAYNRSASEAPAELFRKDLISAMKLADNEPLTADDYWGITDQWKQEWERGVQVPVNPETLPEPSVRQHKDYPRSNNDFRLPRRFIRVTHSDFFNNEKHVLSNLPTKAEKMCRYDMDDLDDAWLKQYNGERARMGAEPVPHHIFELIIEHLEETCWENIHKLLKAEEPPSIEYDEDVICDVCRSPDREEGNEMVFCDSCNICVHQACYGITAIPSGSWLCRTCSLSIKPNCDLCPNKGGAMKSTKSGHKWAHVACALWIPEVSIGSVERMEPITKIANIPQSRWALVCVLCRERRGACIQCSVKSCKTAYHVTCAFKHGLEMKAIVEDTDGVKLRSYCEKHSMTSKKDASDADSDNGSPHKKKKDVSNEQKNQARAAKLRQVEAEFFKHVDVLQTSTILDIDLETTETILYYWKLKRRAGFNKPLLTPRSQDIDLLSQQHEQDNERMKMFVQLRQYLERVRNLCYMVSRREKMSKSFLKTREQTFTKQVAILSDPSMKLSSQEAEAVAQANHGHTIYDKLYSHKGAPVHTQKQFERIVKLIKGASSSKDLVMEREEEGTKSKKGFMKDVNGLLKNKKSTINIFKNNPYRKTYFNGAEQRRSRSASICGSTEASSTEDSDSSLASAKWKPPEPGTRISVFTSSEDENVINRHKINSNSIKSQIHYDSPSSMKSRPKSFESSEDEVKSQILQPPLPPPRPGRGRGTGKRGRGRPRRGSKAPAATRESSLFSSEEEKNNSSPTKSNKIFDSLMKTPTKTSPLKKVEHLKIYPESSDEEDSRKKTRSTKGRGNKQLTPIKQEAFSSSDDDLPTPAKPKPSPPKRGKGRGRGRGSSRQVSSSNPLSSWSMPSKDSDDDNLGPATYKLTSEDDEKSDKSTIVNDLTRRKKELFGPSSGDNRSEASESESQSKKNQQQVLNRRPRKSEARDSDSDALDSDEGKESVGDSQSYSQLKTKAAMKEFTPKITAKAEKLSTRKTSRRSNMSADKTETKVSKEVSSDVVVEKDTSNITNADHSRDLSLFVPQRAAAKKASELITSQNIGVTNIQGSVHLGVTQPDLTTTEVKKQLARTIKELEIEPTLSASDNTVGSVKKITPHKTRRSRSSRERLDIVKNETQDDAEAEPPKKNIFEPPEILPYVPIREAARKAAENLKGVGKGGAAGVIPSGVEDAQESVVTPTKPKKISKIEIKQQASRVTRTKSPRSLNKVHNTESDSGEESDSVAPSVTEKSLCKVEEVRGEKGRSIFSESEDENLTTPKKEKTVIDRIAEPTKEAVHKQQLFRGDIFIRDHQSSSENEDEKSLSSPVRRRESASKTLREKMGSEQTHKRSDRKGKDHSFRQSRNLTRLFGSDDQEEHETENEEPPAETQRKAPDKKLKTSDGRPEHGFQPPVTQRDESRATPGKKPNKCISSKSTLSEEDKQRLRESWVKCRSGTAVGDVSNKDIRSDSDASLAVRKPESAKTSRGERELDQTIKSSEEVSLKNAKDSKDTCRSNNQTRREVQSKEPVQSKQPEVSKASPEKGFKPTFECISTTIQKETPLMKTSVVTDHSKNNFGLSIFNFTEKEVEVKRLADIEETSDTEQEPKKVKIGDSDDDNNFSLVERKVEQPKDSGYKSAMATPEPADRLLTTCNDLGNSNSVINDQLSPEASISLRKNFMQSKASLPKYSSPGRRKNLEDVIEERKKAAEQTDAEAGLLGFAEKRRNELPLTSSPLLQIPVTDMVPSESAEIERKTSQICQLSVSSNASTAGSVNSNSTAPSSFVEEWREQWVKSPQSQAVQMDHLEAAASYPPLTHHTGLPPLNEFQYPFLDMQANHYSNNMNMSMYINQCRMMHLALLQHQYVMPPKTHDSQLEEESNMQSEISSKHAAVREDLSSRLATHVEHPPPRVHYEEPKLPITSKHEPQISKTVQQAQYIENKIPSSTTEVRHIVENKSGSLLVSDGKQLVENKKVTPKLSESRNAVESKKVSTSVPDTKHIGSNKSASSLAESRNFTETKSISSLSEQRYSVGNKNIPASIPDTKTFVNKIATPLIENRNDCANKCRPIPSLPESRHVENKISPVLPVYSESVVMQSSSSDLSLSTVSKPVLSTSKVAETKTAHNNVPSSKQPPELTIEKATVSLSPVVCTVRSDVIVLSSTVTTASSKLPTQLKVSPARKSFSDFSKPVSPMSDISPAYESHQPPTTTIITTKTSTSISGTSVLSSTSKTTVTSPSTVVCSPVTSVLSPTTATKDTSLSLSHSQDSSTVNATVLHSPPQKRIPIYMQEPKTPRMLEKKSPRSHVSSPRWSKQEKRDRKQPAKSNRGKAGRGRGTNKGKRRGSSRFSVSVPKELVGTVYDFDDEFDDDGPANNTLDDLRQLREKRQSIEAVHPPPLPPPLPPSPTPLTHSPLPTPPMSVTQNNTPTYGTETVKDQPPKKRVKVKKIRSSHKEKTPKREEVDEVAKILEDYRNQQNSTLKRSVHEPSPPQLGSPFEPKHHSPPTELVDPLSLEDCKGSSKLSSATSEDKKKQESFKTGADMSGATYTSATVVTSLPEDKTNQLKLKIKGPYANSYLNSNFSAPTQETYSNPAPQSTTTTLRRMRKKELIRQYCYQDMNPDQGDSVGVSNPSKPPQQLRTGITLPKAVASMTSIPTREDYKMYTQDDSTSRGGNSCRRRRQPRELKQLDWTLLEEKGKRNSDNGQDGGRKRVRASKEANKQPQVEQQESAVPVAGKLRISLGKKGSEVSQVTSIIPSTEFISIKGKPPKKRHPEESTILKVKSESLKFREEIMANFDRSGGKNGVGEKRSKKRKLGFGSEGGISPVNLDCRDDEMKVVPNDDSRKLVLKFSKNKSDNGSGGGSDERVGGGNFCNSQPVPLKIRLSLASLSRGGDGASAGPKEGSDTDAFRSSPKERMMPLKIKLQRRPEGYVTSKSTEKSQIDEGPGPPPKPPDLSSKRVNTSTPEDLSLCNTAIEHKDRESLMTEDTTPQKPPAPHSRISEDVLQRLEAQLAATDGGLPLPSILPPSDPLDTHEDFSHPALNPPNSFSALQAIPTLKDESGCR